MSSTRSRVPAHTSSEINAQIQEEIERHVRYYDEHQAEIPERLAALNREWDIERAIEANASVLAFTGTVMASKGDRRWLALPALVTAFLFQHAIQGWCPPVPILRRKERFEVLKPLASAIEQQLHEYLEGQPRIDRITSRAKSIARFLEKARKTENGKVKYTEPLQQIQDQIGARIVTFYESDVEPVAAIIKKYYRLIEQQHIIPESEWEFGYFGLHFVSFIPMELAGDTHRDRAPQFFEIQVKTLFQHAWSEANHDLGYKSDNAPLTPDEKRRLAFTSAQAWGADRIFAELFAERQSH